MAGKAHHQAPNTPRRLLLCAAAVAVAALLLLPSLAAADYEQAPEHFGFNSEASKWLFNSQGIAVNTSGIGLPSGEAGSLYVVGQSNVMRFSAGSEGEEPQFREAWGWEVGTSLSNEFQRCGPALATDPAQHTFHTCSSGQAPHEQNEETGHFGEIGSIAVNQATGYVYVMSHPLINKREHHLIEIFTATGTPVGEGFGDAGRQSIPQETIAESPEKIHNPFTWEMSLAVDDSGNVFVVDRDFNGAPGQSSRVMTFEPCTTGDYENYCYAASRDITTPWGGGLLFSRIGLVGDDRLVAASESLIREYDIGGSGIPICTYQVPGGGLFAMATDPVSGEVFYFSSRKENVHRLSACDETTGKFEELQGGAGPSPPTGEIRSMAFNPDRAWGPQRPPGVLYAIDVEKHEQSGVWGIGDVFVPAEANPPSVLSESIANTTATSSTLKAVIDPHGFGTKYHFQYLSEEAYEANQPDERQSLTVSASGGLFGLAFEGQHLGGIANGDLTAGSSTVANLVVATGTADIRAAKGTANLKAAVGKGTIISGSTKVTGVSASEGTFAVGQTITGSGQPPGIPAGTTIVAVSGTELTLSAPATMTSANQPLQAGSTELTTVNPLEGAFDVGMLISGVGISPGTTITTVAGNKLTLSQPVKKPGTAVAIAAGSTTLNGFVSSAGSFQVGQPLTGEGIPAGATITAVNPGALEISTAPTKSGTGVALSSPGPAPLAVGESIEGPGIPSGTTIAAAKAGELTLSQPATATASGVQLRAGLPFDVSADELRGALEALSTIGSGKVEVTGGPGDETGSSPYEIEFTGFPNQDLPELEADSTGLSGGPASAAVTTANNGGEGFAGATEAPVGGGEIPGSEVGTASANISGLSPETRYRYRVVAASDCRGSALPACEVEGEPAGFATYPEAAAGLPDGRAYEMVSPARKNGGEAFPAQPRFGSCPGQECKPPGASITSVYPIQSAPDGSSVTYFGQPFSSTDGVAGVNSFVSSRTSGGWQTAAMSLPTGNNLTYSPGLDQGILTQEFSLDTPLSSEGPVGYENLYLRSTLNPKAVQPLLTQAMLLALPAHEPRPPHRDPGTLRMGYGGHPSDYSAQYFAANDVLTEETPFAPEPPDPGFEGRHLYEWRQGDLALVNVLPGNDSVATGAKFASVSPDTHAVSEDGSRVFWEAGGHLYVREGGTQTTEIEDPGNFLTASLDGSRVLLDDGCLYSLETASCLDLTEGQGGFLGIAGASEDLTSIYFVDKAALTPEAEPGDCKSVNSPSSPKQQEEDEGIIPAGFGCNLYVYQEGTGTRLVATLFERDGTQAERGALGDWRDDPGQRSAQASRNGRYLAFGSMARLTGYDNDGWREVFLYDSASGSLACASCNPTGEAPRGPSSLPRIEAATISPWLPQPRYLSNSGRLLFDSGDRLSVLDTNGRVEDVYMAEPQGLGSCARPSGCISLITPGTGSVDSNFLAMDEDGANVFFTSRDRLVPKDTDELIDVYDAREGGGFPAETESQRVECQGESCQPVPQAPNDISPGTSTLHGAGNVKEAKKHHKKKHHKHKKKHQKHKKQAAKKRASNQNRGGAG